MEEKKCPKCGAPCDIAVIMDETPRVVDSNTHVQYIFKPPAGAVWVRASERLPVNGGVDNKVIVRGILNEQGYANHRFVAYGFRNFSPVKQEMYFEYGSKSFLTNNVEWLDESEPAAGREEDAVAFVNWTLSSECDTYTCTDEDQWTNIYTQESITTAQLYELFNKQKEK